MPFSGTARRFTVTTGSVPETQAVGCVFANGWTVYQAWLPGGSDGIWTQEIAGSIDQITNRWGSNAGYALTYTDASSVTLPTVSPMTDVAAGGASITLTGTGFLAPGLTVTFGGTAATDVMVNAAGTSITCTAPAHAAGSVSVVVTNANGTATKTGFTYT